MIRTHAIIKGKVQGVAFRYQTMVEAQRIGVYGWIRNLPSGNVEAVFEGPKEKVAQIISWCHAGPGYSVVDDVDVTMEDYSGNYNSFDIIR